jgi:hypothetical protein
MKRLPPGTRPKHVAQLRNFALQILAKRGLVTKPRGIPHLQFECVGLRLSHPAPFSPTNGLERRLDFPASWFAVPSHFDRQYLLDIHDDRRKVMHLQWEAGDSVLDLVSLKRGLWEILLAELASGVGSSPQIYDIDPGLNRAALRALLLTPGRHLH